MTSKKKLRAQLLASCAETGPDDGVDPRTYFRKTSREKTNRKCLQLCGQVARTLSSILGWESADDHLRDLTVVSVQPAPDSTRLLVTIALAGAGGTRSEER